MSDRGVIEFNFAGARHVVPAKIGLTIACEEATGRGIVTLMRELATASIMTRHAAEIIRQAIKRAGADLDDEELFEAVDSVGVMKTFETASKIVAGLMKGPPKAARGKKSLRGAMAPA